MNKRKLEAKNTHSIDVINAVNKTTITADNIIESQKKNEISAHFKKNDEKLIKHITIIINRNLFYDSYTYDVLINTSDILIRQVQWFFAHKQ